MPDLAWRPTQTRSQFGAIARLRWQMYRNGFRRKGGKGDLAANLILAPFALLILGLMCVGAATGAYFIATSDKLEHMAWVCWGIFVLSQMLNLNLGQPGTTFDPTQLIRFPMRVGSYTVVRLFFGVLSPGNIIVVMMSLSAAGGVVLALHSLWAYALVAMAVFAAVNVLFTRMIFSWVDRWLSTRRAREVFTALIFLGSMGVQVLNFAYNPAYHNKRINKQQVGAAAEFYAKAEPWLAALPPGLTGNSLEAAAKGRAGKFGGETAGCAAFGLVFLYVFALRMRVEYRGENLSDRANGVAKEKPRPARAAAAALPEHAGVSQGAGLAAPASSQAVVWIMIGKEFLYLRRNIGLFYGLLMPLVFIVVFAGKWAGRSGGHHWVFPAAVAYGLLGVFPTSFNSFGLDTTGTQFYFMAPVRLRDVLLGKNALCAMLAIVEAGAVLAVVTFKASAPSVPLLLGTVLWAVAVLFVELTVGNYQSIRSPRKIDPGRTAQKQARPASAFASMGILLAAALVGAGCLSLASYLGLLWILPATMLLVVLICAVIYWTNVNKLDAYALEHRDTLFEELGKKS
jgi:ABC-2 type transport system permease protein